MSDRCYKHWNKHGRLIEIDCPVCDAQREARRLLRRFRSVLRKGNE